MDRRRLLFVILVVAHATLSAGMVHAGPTLDAALQRERTGDGAVPAAEDEHSGVELSFANDALNQRQVHLVAPALGGYRGIRVVQNLWDGPALDLKLGVAARDGASRVVDFEGSRAAWTWQHSEFYASVERRHWGPGHAGSLILDGAAAALPALGWRRPALRASTRAWLRWLGPWHGDVFVGGLTEHREPERPMLIGMRIDLGGGHRAGAGAWWLRSAGWRGGSAQGWWQYAWS